ncbi:MAG: phosphotransferase [Acidimicrobiales bacterium]
MPAAPVPANFDEISADWLSAALSASSTASSDASGVSNVSNVSVSAVEVAPLGPSVGLLGDLARLHISYCGTPGPSSMIVKLPTSDPGGHQVGSMLRAWAREVAFYTEVAPASPGAKVPICYHADGDPAAERWVVLLEDIASDPVDANLGATPAQAEAAVVALSEFHAAWWQSPDRFGWMPGFDGGGVGGLQAPWIDALPIFLDRYGHLVPEPAGEWIQRFAPTLGQWSDRVAGEPLTVVHADYRIDNLLFNDDGVTMIDWQTALRGPGAMDLTSFVITSLTIEDRRANEEHLIAMYVDSLASAGVDVDRDWFRRSYDENLLWWMGQFANNLARLEPEDPAIQRSLDTMIERTYTAAVDRDVGRLLG